MEESEASTLLLTTPDHGELLLAPSRSARLLNAPVESVEVELQVCYLNRMTGFGVAAALELAQISYRQLDYWARTGLVGSSVRQAAGKGSRRVYAFEDLVALRVVAGLRSAGVPLQAVRRALRYLRRHAGRPLNTLALVPDGMRLLVLTDDPQKMIEATAEGQVVISLDVAPIRRRLEQGVSELSAKRELLVRAGGRSFRVVLTPDLEAGGFTVTVPDLPGCITEGDTVAEARATAREAITGWLEASERRASARVQ